MTRSERITAMLERYGNPVRIAPKTGAPVCCRAMIQPMSVRRIPDSDTLGVVGSDLEKEGMLYIGPVSCRIDQFGCETRIIDHNGIEYRAVRAHCVAAAGAPLYVWAILQQLPE